MPSPPVISLEDYDVIAAAVMETERGRWFLAEFARRNRVTDTEAVLAALAAVEARLADRPMIPMLPAAGSPIADAAERVAAAAQSAERLRMDLAASNRQGRLFARTAAQVEEIERELALALSALRPGAGRSAGPRIGAAPDEPAPASPALADPAEDARKAAEDRRLADLAEELARPIGFDEPEVAEVLADRDTTRAAGGASEPRGRGAINGATHDPARNALPKAWTPSLLDSLSETEKAMLFA